MRPPALAYPDPIVASAPAPMSTLPATINAAAMIVNDGNRIGGPLLAGMASTAWSVTPCPQRDGDENAR